MTFESKPIVPVVQALTKVMEEVGAVAKKDRNSAQNFNFRGIDAVVNAVAPALRKHEVVVTPTVLDYRYENVEIGKNRSLMGHVIVTVKYTFRGAGGDIVEATVIGEAMDSGDKAVPKAMSVAFRTALLQALSLPTDEPDPDSHSYERSEARPVEPPKTPIDPMGLDMLRTSMYEATDLVSLNFVAQQANAYALTDEQRADLKIVYLGRKKEITPDTLLTHENDTGRDVAVGNGTK